jgi:hypothetical protein
MYQELLEGKFEADIRKVFLRQIWKELGKGFEQ